MSDETENTGTDTEQKRGRGRPNDTVDRDDKVFAALDTSTEPLTREQLAVAAGVESAQAYLSLYRLKRDNKVYRMTGVKGFSNKYWPVGKDVPNAPEAPAEAAEAAPAPPEG